VLTDRIASSVLSMMNRCFSDTRLYKSVTWKKFTSSTYNEATGYNVDAYTDYTLQAVKADAAQSSWAKGFPSGFGGSGMEAIDTVFFFKTADMPADIDIRDVIVDGSTNYRVKSITPIIDTVTQVSVQAI